MKTKNKIILGLFALIGAGALALAIDNTTTNTGALVTAGQANIGEVGVATVSHGLADVNGNIVAQVSVAGNLAVSGTPATAAAFTGGAFPALTDGATITVAVGANGIGNGTVTLGGSRTLAFSNLIPGAHGVLLVKQDATGSRVLTGPSTGGVTATKAFPSGAGSNVIVTSSTASFQDWIDWWFDGTNIYTRTSIHGG